MRREWGGRPGAHGSRFRNGRRRVGGLLRFPEGVRVPGQRAGKGSGTTEGVGTLSTFHAPSRALRSAGPTSRIVGRAVKTWEWPWLPRLWAVIRGPRSAHAFFFFHECGSTRPQARAPDSRRAARPPGGLKALARRDSASPASEGNGRQTQKKKPRANSTSHVRLQPRLGSPTAVAPRGSRRGGGSEGSERRRPGPLVTGAARLVVGREGGAARGNLRGIQTRRSDHKTVSRAPGPRGGPHGGQVSTPDPLGRGIDGTTTVHPGRR